jgi:hypothetical protein
MSLTGFSQLVHPKQAAMVSITNKATGGSIGDAADTVDIATLIVVTQTTAGQTLTLPDPTNATPGMVIGVVNIGTQDFTMATRTVANGDPISLFWWDGSDWN